MSVGRIIVFSNSNIQRYQSMGIFEDYTCIAVSLYSLFPRIGLTWPKGRGHSMPQRPIRTRYQLWCATRVFGCHHTLAHVIEWNVVRTMWPVVWQLSLSKQKEQTMNWKWITDRTEQKKKYTIQWWGTNGHLYNRPDLYQFEQYPETLAAKLKSGVKTWKVLNHFSALLFLLHFLSGPLFCFCCNAFLVVV